MKLLRVLQEGVVEPVGSDRAVKVDVRVVSATHRNLKERIKEGLFREDLYYRIKVLDLDVPPLRDRRDDLTLLVQHFLARNLPEGTKPPTISPQAWAVFMAYPFPGNVRELEHAVEHAKVLSGGRTIDVEHLPSDLVGEIGLPRPDADLKTLSSASAEFERQYILRALVRAEKKKTQAAKLLGISRKNLWEKMKAHGIEESDYA